MGRGGRPVQPHGQAREEERTQDHVSGDQVHPICRGSYGNNIHVYI